MNQNKLQMKLNNKSIYEFIFETIKNCRDYFKEIIVVAKDDEILDKAEYLGFKAVRNEISYMGQSASVKLGIENSGKTDGYMFFVADQPFIKEDTIRRLLKVFEKHPNGIVLACHSEINGNPVIFSEVFKEQLMKLEGDTGGKVIIKDNMDKVVRVKIHSEDELTDIDTMEDYNKLINQVDSMRGEVIVVKGGGDIASGIIQKLHRVGFRVLVLETENPTSIRRTVCFSEAVYEGRMEIEGIVSLLAKDIKDVYDAWSKDCIPVVIDPQGTYIPRFNPIAIVDAIIAKRNTGMKKDAAPVSVAVGPGFEAGKDAHAVIESNRGHNLGRLIFSGFAEQNTKEPGDIGGFTFERVLNSPDDGSFITSHKIGDLVKKGDIIGQVNGKNIVSKLDGVIRGLIREGIYVYEGQKIGDVDPRGDAKYCYTISDKSRAIGGAVLEAVLILINKLR